MLSSLVCLGRHTITGLLHTAGGSFQDWSALYRVFSQSRVDSEALFGTRSPLGAHPPPPATSRI